jgi:hypothetical protein
MFMSWAQWEVVDFFILTKKEENEKIGSDYSVWGSTEREGNTVFIRMIGAETLN